MALRAATQVSHCSHCPPPSQARGQAAQPRVVCMQAPTAAASRAAPRKAVVCAAARTSQVDVSKAVAAAALATVIGFGQVDAAKADISGLTPCSESKAYQKRLKNELKALNKRLKNVRVLLQLACDHAHHIRQHGRSSGAAKQCSGAGQPWQPGSAVVVWEVDQQLSRIWTCSSPMWQMIIPLNHSSTHGSRSCCIRAPSC